MDHEPRAVSAAEQEPQPERPILDLERLSIEEAVLLDRLINEEVERGFAWHPQDSEEQQIKRDTELHLAIELADKYATALEAMPGTNLEKARELIYAMAASQHARNRTSAGSAFYSLIRSEQAQNSDYLTESAARWVALLWDADANVSGATSQAMGGATNDEQLRSDLRAWFNRECSKFGMT